MVQNQIWLCAQSKVMFTLYQTGFCSISKGALVQCEQELMFCCGAETVSKSYNLQHFLLIWKDQLPKRGSIAISASIEVFRLDLDRFENLSNTECSTFNSGAVLFPSRNCFESSILVWTEALSDTLFGTLHFTVRYSVNIAEAMIQLMFDQE